MKDASLVLFVDDNGEVMHALNVDKESGKILTTDIADGEEENKANKKIVGGKLKSRIVYPNTCCWKFLNGKWVCVPC